MRPDGYKESVHVFNQQARTIHFATDLAETMQTDVGLLVIFLTIRNCWRLAMTKSELRELIGRVRSNKYLMRSETDYIIKALKEVEQYRSIGTPEECQAAVEKQTGIKPAEMLGIFNNTEYEYKNCGSNVNYMDEYCRWCGQKLDWEDEE